MSMLEIGQETLKVQEILANETEFKNYIKSVTSSTEFKETVLAATVSNLASESSISGVVTYSATTGTYSDGKLTATLAVSNTFSVDGITFTSSNNGARILVKNQTVKAQNGIYALTISGTSLTLNRTWDFNSTSVNHRTSVFVSSGNTQAKDRWSLDTSKNVVIGGAYGSDLIFVKMSEDLSVSNVGTAGIGIYKETAGGDIKLRKINSSNAKVAVTLASDEVRVDVGATVVGTTDVQTLTNKTLDCDTNTVSNIADANIKSTAAITVSKVNFQLVTAESVAKSTTVSTVFVNKLTHTTGVLQAGNYILHYSADIGNTSNIEKVAVRCTVDAVSVGEATLLGTATNEYKSFSGSKPLTLTAAAHTIAIDYKALAAGTAEIINASIVLYRLT